MNTPLSPLRDVLAIVVLYNKQLAHSRTLQSLREARQLAHGLRILVYDNSAAPQPPINADFDIEYLHDARNSGVCGAYNEALRLAQSRGITWLLLLDDDTHISGTYLLELQQILLATASAAIVPKVRSSGRLVSPSRMRFGIVRPLSPDAHREHVGITAINSAAVVRVSALQELGGFSTDYWLDFLDHWLFREFAIRRWSVYVAESVIEHSLSVTDYNRFMTPQRYANVLLAESHFISQQSVPTRLIYRLRLLARAVSQWRTVRDRSIARLTWTHFIGRSRSVLRT